MCRMGAPCEPVAAVVEARGRVPTRFGRTERRRHGVLCHRQDARHSEPCTARAHEGRRRGLARGGRLGGTAACTRKDVLLQTGLQERLSAGAGDVHARHAAGCCSSSGSCGGHRGLSLGAAKDTKLIDPPVWERLGLQMPFFGDTPERRYQIRSDGVRPFFRMRHVRRDGVSRFSAVTACGSSAMGGGPLRAWLGSKRNTS